MTAETVTFEDLNLSSTVVQSVREAGYTTPTEIQAKAIPLVMQRRDIIGLAQTGTGKTASFTLPMISILEKGRARARMPRTLILEPTRELAAQVADSFEKYGKNSNLTLALLIGGVSMDEQEQKLMRGADVLIATPGRLIDHFERGRLLLSATEVLVIDEADRMLDMGFIPDIERIASMLPFSRQNLLFSATMPKEIRKFVDAFVPSATEISVSAPSETAKTITQKFVAAPKEASAKRERLRAVIQECKDIQNAIIFCNRKRDAAIVGRSMEKHGFKAAALHGDMVQSARIDVLESFKANEIQFLVASDVAARGLDVPSVSHVFNYDIPIHAEDYVHRIGRTGRAGREGNAFTMVCKADQKYFDAIVSNSNLDVTWHETFSKASLDTVDDNAKPRSRSAGSDARRDSTRKERPQASARSNSRHPQASVGEMNKTNGPILGFGEHTPDFMFNGVSNEAQPA